MEKICPKCGASSEDREFVGAFCATCIPIGKIECASKVIVSHCPRCGKGETKADIEKLILKTCKGKYENARYDSEKGEVVFLVRAGGAVTEVWRKVDVAVKERACADCAKAAGGYFEAIVQLRGDREKVSKFCDSLARAIERKSFVPKIDELKEGIDIYVGDKRIVPEILESNRLTFTRAEKLAGEKNGKRLYRSTFCVRL